MTCKHIDAAGLPILPHTQTHPFDNEVELRPPTAVQAVYREDCTQCFDSNDDEAGLNVCLYCFNGGCAGERDHALLHSQQSRHPLVLNIKRTRKRVKRDEPPQKMSKLAIAAETEEDRYDTQTEVRCYDCGIQGIDPNLGKLPAVVEGVLKANTFARQAEVKAWEQELTPCEHTLCLEQEPSRKVDSQDLAKCSMCDLKENLWLCLQCGHLGCGRAQFGGVGGNSHAVAHKSQTNHPVAVKLGSITADGSADVYCYACDDERTDPEIAYHLAYWGINIAERQKTEKSLTEMQVEQNLKWDFSMTTEDGKEMQPTFGPGFTGLKNLGNSCYLASVVQCLFSLPEFQRRYFRPQDPPPEATLPAEDLETQLRKIADGLLSGRYSKNDTDVTASENSPEIPSQKGLAPAMLKHLIGKGHEEFSTMRQQDAFELLLHLWKLITRSPHPASQDPTHSFRFVLEQRLQCLSCKKVRYRTDEQDNISIPVPATRISRDQNKPNETSNGKDEYEPVTLKTCLDTFTAPETVDLTCPSCASTAGFEKRTLFKTFPRVLAINARRFALINWVPTKLDIPVLIDDNNPIDLTIYKSSGLQPSETELPEDAAAAPSTDPAFAPNELACGQLEAMGFPRVRAEKALHATGNEDAEAAMNWLIAHMDDPDIDQPVPLSAPSGSAGGASAGVGAGGAQAVSAESIETLGAMGIAAPQARKALKETGGDVNRALDWVFSHPDDQGDFGDDGVETEGQAGQGGKDKALPGSEEEGRMRLSSIVCHKGASIHAGHYVAFIRKTIPDTGEEAWVLFNDEKVVKAEGDAEEMKKFAYVYFFERV